MPLLQLTYPEGSLEPDVRSSLVADLTAALMRWEGAPDTPRFRSATWVHVDERPSWAVNAAGSPVDAPHYLLSATVPLGALSERRKDGLIEETTALILAADGGDEVADRIWVHVHEMPDHTWGAGGRPVLIAELAAAAARERADAGRA